MTPDFTHAQSPILFSRDGFLFPHTRRAQGAWMYYLASAALKEGHLTHSVQNYEPRRSRIVEESWRKRFSAVHPHPLLFLHRERDEY